MGGHSKTVHFPLALGAGDSSLVDSPALSPAQRLRRPRPPSGAEHRPSILVVGEVGRDYMILGDKLRSLHHDPAGYHGNLQVMLSAIRRIEDGIKVLIGEVEG